MNKLLLIIVLAAIAVLVGGWVMADTAEAVNWNSAIQNHLAVNWNS